MPKLLNKTNLPNYASAPSSPTNGDIYYNTTDHIVYARVNGAWVDLAASGGAGTYSAGTGLTLTANEFAIGTAVVTLSGTQTITNKTLTAPSIGAAGAAFIGSTSGAVTVQAPAIAGSGTVTFATSGTMLTSSSTLSAANLSGTIPGTVLGKATINYTASGSASITTRNVGDIWIDSTDTTTYTAGIPVTAFDAKGDFLVGTGADTYTVLPTGTAGQTLMASGTSGASPYYTWIDKATVNQYSTSGSFSWVKPTGAKAVYVLVVGGGGGGGSGARINESTSTIYSGGGCGGGGGGFVQRWIDAASLPGTITVTVGAGGSGGAQITATATLTAGNAGGTGAASTFGTLATATGGFGGGGGIISTGTAAGTLTAPGVGNGYGPTGVPSWTTTAPAPAVTTVTYAQALSSNPSLPSWGGWGVIGASSGLTPNTGLYSVDNPVGPAGGASGGGKSAALATAMKGGNGGRGFGFTFDAPASGGAAFGSGTVGGTGSAGGTIGWGNGGGGGASGGSANGGPGGAGYAGGGGGGGGAANGTTIATVRGGAGGAGGDGIVYILSI